MLSAAKNANLLLMFLLELGVLASAGYWGFTLNAGMATRLFAGIGAVALFIAVWWLFGAANGAVIPLHGLARVALEVLWFGGGALALTAAGQTTPAIIFAAVYLGNAALRLIWQQ